MAKAKTNRQRRDTHIEKMSNKPVVYDFISPGKKWNIVDKPEAGVSLANAFEQAKKK